jgi:CRP-like cAMP-binding protein
VPVAELLAVLRINPPIYDLFLRYVHCCDLQLAQSALADARYSVHERLARWLLMCHDRLDGDDLPLTHEFLSIMLGVRRSGVTDQIHIQRSTPFKEVSPYAAVPIVQADGSVVSHHS